MDNNNGNWLAGAVGALILICIGVLAVVTTLFLIKLMLGVVA
jgi:hypothetical protein